MSNIPFIESGSSDPAERAIARKVVRILNDRTLDRQQRETLVRKAQRELIELRQRAQEREVLRQRLDSVQLPTGYEAQSIAVSNGRMQVGALKKGGGFAWFDAGQVPDGVRNGEFQIRVAHLRKAVNR